MITCDLCNFSGPMLPFYPSKGIVKCPQCSLVFYSSQDFDIAKLYSADYFAGDEYHDYIGDKNIIQRNFKSRIEELKKLKPEGKMLEIGCAYGFFMELAREHWDVTGIDISQDAINAVHKNLGLNAIAGDFLAMPDQPESYDIICMWDTIEHLDKPRAFIEKASRWLKKDGILVMTTGDIASKVAQRRKENWRMMHPPTHLFYFSPSTLGTMVENSGLRVIDTKHPGCFRSYKSAAYSVFALNKPKTAWVYKLMTLNGVIDFPVYLNLFDIMQVTARKEQIR